MVSRKFRGQNLTLTYDQPDLAEPDAIQDYGQWFGAIHKSFDSNLSLKVTFEKSPEIIIVNPDIYGV